MNVRTWAHPIVLLTLAAALTLLAGASAIAGDMTHTSGKFEGVKANTGTVTHSVVNGKSVLTLSDDFVPPDTPDPHWQVVDSQGRTYLLDRLTVKGGRMNKSITVPDFVPDVVKVQIYCAWAEALLGEASFSMAVK
jgi:hypothetical protein